MPPRGAGGRSEFASGCFGQIERATGYEWAAIDDLHGGGDATGSDVQACAEWQRLMRYASGGSREDGSACGVVPPQAGPVARRDGGIRAFGQGGDGEDRDNEQGGDEHHPFRRWCLFGASRAPGAIANRRFS